MSVAMLDVCGIRVSYPTPAGPRVVVDGLSLALARGEVGCLLGASGCGKTTVLRAIAGFEPLQAGTVALDGQLISSTTQMLPPERRGVGMMFQDYALFPHLDVARNVGFGLSRQPRREREARVAEVLELVGLPDRAGAWPHELSGGQQQRVALARSLAKGPKLLLLDEPMGALDKKLRSQMQLELVNIIETSGVTCVMVTHDQEEAMTMATRIALMDSGRIRQVGTPDEIYESPTSRFAAEFIGSVNMFNGKVDEDMADYVTIVTPSLEATMWKASFPGVLLPVITPGVVRRSASIFERSSLSTPV